MENRKIILILAVILIITSCSFIDPLSEDGWTYLKNNDFAKAHARFLRDFSDFPDSLDIVGGLSYTFFAFDERDSAKYYLDLSREIEPDNNFSIFVSLMYFRDEPESVSKNYRAFVSKYAEFPLYALREAVKSNSLHKLGLTNEIERDSFSYIYNILKRITDISDSLDTESSTDRFIMIEYINDLEE
ncbi:TPA: hypothetical protein DCW38_00195 [candidate division WOR-3 bacterium]|uniref:Tetratricopeptide repeat protein n=1 Tax=candidate division WOR-3 bacterium TaxID=2052148 RepID=A0A350H7T3_UNCW3|nr:hypothetical protein [candidate division WOR-3 bacterium]